MRGSAVRPMKSGLSSLTAQSMSEPARRGVHLGVHADDHVALLQAQREQRLQAVRADAEVGAGRISACHSSTEGSAGGAARSWPRR